MVPKNGAIAPASVNWKMRDARTLYPIIPLKIKSVFGIIKRILGLIRDQAYWCYWGKVWGL